MPYPEFLGWLEYFRRRPPLHEFDQSISVILRCLGVKDPEKVLPRLKLLEEGKKSQIEIDKTKIEEDDDGLMYSVPQSILEMAKRAKGGAKFEEVERGQK